MNVLIKSVKIINKQCPFHNRKMDVLIENGKYSKIATTIKNTNGVKEISKKNLHLSVGWFDSAVSFGEPGYEERETITNGLKVAAKSGFTAVALNANTNPPIDNKSAVEFLVNKAKSSPVALYPIANLTKNGQGQELAEVYDMSQSGAIAFGDYNRPITNANLMKIALLYSKNFDGLVLSFPQDNSLVNDGVANEGVISTQLGLKGNPSLAEELRISRDLFLLEYTGGKLHIPTITSANSVKLIANAKKKGLDVSCSVSPHHIGLTDTEIKDFNTNYKVNPPLRTKKDANALIKGLENGTIDMICSDHNPIDIENKKVEFENALEGTIGLESCFGAVHAKLPLETVIEALTSNPRVRFKIKNPLIEKGAKVEITLFNPDFEYTFTQKDIFSSSKNAAFLNKNLKGKVYGIFTNNSLTLT